MNVRLFSDEEIEMLNAVISYAVTHLDFLNDTHEIDIQESELIKLEKKVRG